jgi:hypothetical protein
MKLVISKNIKNDWLKKRKKDKAKLVRYWSNLYPEDYARSMVAKSTQGKSIS